MISLVSSDEIALRSANLICVVQTNSSSTIMRVRTVVDGVVYRVSEGKAFDGYYLNKQGSSRRRENSPTSLAVLEQDKNNYDGRLPSDAGMRTTFETCQE